MANSVDPDQMPHSVLSDLGLSCLLRHVCLNIQGYYGILFLNENISCKEYQLHIFWLRKKKIIYYLVIPLNKAQGPVVQSIVNLTSSLRVISLTVLADSLYSILIFFC